MSEDVLAHVFEPFFTTKGVGQGTGLGLATVYGIVKQSGGHIEVSSSVGEGTTFRVYLPLIEEPKPRRSDEMRLAAKGRETILLVEDEEAVRRMTKMILSQSGYTVLEASNGKEALAVAGTPRADPLAADRSGHAEPVRAGGGRAAGYRQSRACGCCSCPGYTEDVIVRQGVESATADFLPKPFSLAALTNKVTGGLGPPLMIESKLRRRGRKVQGYRATSRTATCWLTLLKL